jgi:hypothetical protein
MVRELINQMLGPAGRAILGFYFTHQMVINGLFLIWATLMTAASVQLRRVRQYTIGLVQNEVHRHPDQSDQEIWQAVLPQWTAALPGLVRFVPNRWDLWVQRATPGHVARLLKLGPIWVGALRVNGRAPRDALTLPNPGIPLKGMSRKRVRKQR